MLRPSSRRIVLPAAACLLVSCLEAPTSPISEFPDGQQSFEPGNPSAPGVNFEALRLGDGAVLHFQSEGCFHHFVGDVLLTRTESGLAVRVLRENANPAPGWRIVTDTALSLEEVRALDRTLTFYRSDPGSGCTTVDRVTIEGFGGARTESYVDGSCATFEAADMLAIGRLFRVVPASARPAPPNERS